MGINQMLVYQTLVGHAANPPADVHGIGDLSESSGLIFVKLRQKYPNNLSREYFPEIMHSE